MNTPPEWAYWVLASLWFLTIVALNVVAYQRDKARTNADLYRSALIRVDREEAQAIAAVAAPTPRRWFHRHRFHDVRRVSRQNTYQACWCGERRILQRDRGRPMDASWIERGTFHEMPTGPL
jgi:hypothetical protein